MEFNEILYKVSGPTATIVLNRPEKINAITRRMSKEVGEALDIADHDKSVRVVVLSGAGPHFSAGVDLGEAFTYEPTVEPSSMWREHLDSLLGVGKRLWSLTKPTIAVVRGHVLGGAADWVLSVDLAIGSETTQIGEPEIQYGAAPPTLMMPWIVGIRGAKELLMTGDIVDAHKARTMGILNRVVSDDELETAGQELACKIARAPAAAMRLQKMALNQMAEIQGLMNALDFNREMAIAMYFLKSATARADTKELINRQGVKAFLELQRRGE